MAFLDQCLIVLQEGYEWETKVSSGLTTSLLRCSWKSTYARLVAATDNVLILAFY